MKNAIKKAISILLVAVMVICAAPLAGFVGLDLPELNLFSTKAEAATSGYYTYSVSGGEATITGVDSSISGDIVIPSTLGGYPVTSIGNSAFYGCTSLESVTIPDGVTSIGDYAFKNCSYISNITIGKGVKSIRDAAFLNCGSLENIYYRGDEADWCGIKFEKGFSNPLIYAKNLYINGALIKNLVIPYGVTNISSYAFAYFVNLESVTLPDSLTSISDWAFTDCHSLTNITLPDSVTNISRNAFTSCINLESVTISANVTSIGGAAFGNCYSLKDVYYIGTQEDWNKMSIGASNEDLLDAKRRFVVSGKCGDNLIWMFEESTGELTISGTGDMYDLSNTGAPWYRYRLSIKTVTIGNGVTSIGGSAFEYCRSLTSITIPDSVTSIGYYAFSDCNNLTSVTIPDSVTSIGYYAFSDCYNLTSVTIPDGVTSIDSAFSGCDSLTSITIPDSVTSIGSYAFAGTSLASITIPDSVTSIGDYAFTETSIEDVTIPESVTSIDDFAFSYCTSLTSVTIPDSVMSIGEGVFLYCKSLASVTIDNSVTHIDKCAFGCCDSLKDVYYGGTQAEWNEISIKSDNDPLLDANIHFNHIHTVSKVKEKVDPTCTENGYKTGECVCGYSLTEVILALNHKDTLVQVKAKVPTCTEIGWDAYEYCTSCEYTTYAEKEALKHDIIIDEAVESTCTETGLTAGQHCSRCDDMTVAQEIVPALNHKDTLVQVKAKVPTCTEIGWDAYEYCTACEYTTYAEKEPLKHDIIVDEAVEATCTETGLTAGQHCSRCDDMTVEQEVVSTKPHKHIARNDSEKHWKECDCGSVIEEQNHYFVGGNVCSCGFRRVVDASIKIKNNTGSKTINYGETLKLTATVNNKPSNAKICWFVDGFKAGEGEVFNIDFESGSKIVTVKLVDENGVVYQDANGNEILDTENVTVNGGFFQKIISFFKNLFGMNRTVIQVIFGK